MLRARRRLRGALAIAAAASLALGAAGCAPRPEPTALEVGRHRVRLTLPTGWEHLDHGRIHLFRRGDASLSLEDAGPASHQGLIAELNAARGAWLEGRRRDAFARVEELKAPALSQAESGVRAAFWRPWWAMQQ